MTLTTRTKIELRYCSRPACLGHADTREKAQEAIAAYFDKAPRFIGTPRQIREKLTEIASNWASPQTIGSGLNLNYTRRS